MGESPAVRGVERSCCHQAFARDEHDGRGKLDCCATEPTAACFSLGALGRRHAAGGKEHDLLYVRPEGTLFYKVHVMDSAEIHENLHSCDSPRVTAGIGCEHSERGVRPESNPSCSSNCSSTGCSCCSKTSQARHNGESPAVERRLQPLAESVDAHDVFNEPPSPPQDDVDGRVPLLEPAPRRHQPLIGGCRRVEQAQPVALPGAAGGSGPIVAGHKLRGSGEKVRGSPPTCESPSKFRSTSMVDMMKKIRGHSSSSSSSSPPPTRHKPPPGSPKSAGRASASLPRGLIGSTVLASSLLASSSLLVANPHAHADTSATVAAATAPSSAFHPGHRRVPSDPLGGITPPARRRPALVLKTEDDSAAELVSNAGALLDSPLQRSASFRILRRGPAPGKPAQNGVVERKDSKGQIASDFLFNKSSKAAVPIMQFNVRQLAEEMALMDGEQLRRIRCHELEDCSWIKKKKSELAPNIVKMIGDFNRTALAISTDILSQKTPQARAPVIVFLIKLAVECHQLHNYNTLQAILGGLQCAAIHRLTLTWKEVPSKWHKHLQKLAALMGGERNFANYRRALEGALAQPPCVPFLGVFLSQVALMDAYQSEKPEPEVTEKKSEEDSDFQLMPSMDSDCQLGGAGKTRVASALILSELWKYQLASIYQGVTRDTVRDFLVEWPHITEKEAYKLSEELEPPAKRLS